MGDRAARGADHRLHDRALGAPAIRIPGARQLAHHQRGTRYFSRGIRRLGETTRDDRMGVASARGRSGSVSSQTTCSGNLGTHGILGRSSSGGIMRNIAPSLAIALGASFSLSIVAVARADPPGLGAVLTSQDGGQIFGFDINQNGDDGVLASAQDRIGGVLVSVETFDQDSGRITRSFKRELGNRNEYSVDGIFAGDTALITHYVTPN